MTSQTDRMTTISETAEHLQEEQTDDIEKPLSPVLNHSKINRKFLFGRRTHKKARACLSNTFDKLANESKNSSVPYSDLKSSTEYEVKKLVPFENKIKKHSPATSTSVKTDINSCFKVPLSPAPHPKKHYETEHLKTHSDGHNSYVTSPRYQTDVTFPRHQTIGFKTAGGKAIIITESTVKQHSKLFDDILIPEKHSENNRKKKYSFLSKSKNVETINDQSNFDKSLKENLHNDNKHDANAITEPFVSFTQMISDSGISNSQIISVCDNLMNDDYFKKVSTEANKQSKQIQTSAINKLDSKNILVREQELYEKTELALKAASGYCRNDKSDNVNSNDEFVGFQAKEITASVKISVKVSDLLDNILQNIENSLSCTNIHRSIPERTIFSITDQKTNPCNSLLSDNILKSNHTSHKIRNKVSGDKREKPDSLKSPPTKKSKTDTFSNRVNEFSAENLVIKNHVSGNEPPSFNDKDCKQDVVKIGTKIKLETDKLKGSYKGDSNSSPFNIMSCGFKTASGNKINLSEKMIQNAKKIFDSDTSELPGVTTDKDTVSPLPPETHSFGFKTASGNKIKISDKTLQNAKKMFESCDITDVGGLDSKPQPVSKLQKNNSFVHGSKSVLSEPVVSDKETSVGDVDCVTGFSKAKLPTELKQKSTELATFSNCNSTNIKPNHFINIPGSSKGFKSAFGADIEIAQQSFKAKKPFYSEILQGDFPAEPVYKAITNKIADVGTDFKNLSSRKEEGRDNLLPTDESDNSINNSDIVNVQNQSGETSRNTSKSKRRLGVSSCKPLSLSETQLQRARLLFKDDFPLALVTAPPARPSPVPKFGQISSHSTPLKHNAHYNLSTFVDSTITPIKCSRVTSKPVETIVDCQLYTDAPLLIQKPTDGNIDIWIKDIERERCLLQKKLEILTHRSEALVSQKRLLEDNILEHSRRLGALSQRKALKPRVTWLKLVKGKRPGDSFSSIRLPRITEVTPQNAENVHFNCLLGDNSGTIETDDGAVVVPNSNNLIGFSEIESAFKVTPGVEVKLIPKGWIKNHFKWIVWKLASYERSFPEECEGCFSAENILLQLKYRYDREIDKAERPALRKIYERDDSSQKRMILCVCDIIKVNNSKFELVLTDSWYSIRTVIDEPLCEQVNQGKIQIGTKLIISGAELLNCDGCSPLETTELVRLKITFNSTRRARWYSKLGYQCISSAFPIPTETVNPLGGNIGCLKIHIARVYPIRYMERQDNVTVWRNRRAEERRAQEWENEQMKKIEDIRDRVCREYDMESSPRGTSESENCSNIKYIKCPKTLYHMLKNCSDPEHMQEELTESQRKAVLKYQQNMSVIKHQEISSKITENLNKIKQLKRDVSSIMKLIVLDIYKPSNEGVTFHIWNPTENHLAMLKEGKHFYVYNVSPKRNGDLSTSAKTRFVHLPDVEINCDLFVRRFIPISQIQQSVRKLFLNEFDTVGIVVKTNIQSCGQELWLSDAEGRLLHIKISESPLNCILLDNLRRGQIVCCSNIISCQRTDMFSQGLANHFTVFSSHPQQRHLQDGLELFQKQISKDINEILCFCDINIKEYSNKININPSKSLHQPDVSDKSTTTLDDSTEESTLVYSRITSTDIAMSLIDIDQFK